MTAGLLAAGARVSILPPSHLDLSGPDLGPHQAPSGLRAFALSLPPARTVL